MDLAAASYADYLNHTFAPDRVTMMIDKMVKISAEICLGQAFTLKGVPVELEAVPQEGYDFVGWQRDSEGELEGNEQINGNGLGVLDSDSI